VTPPAPNLGTIYTVGQPRVDPDAGYAEAEDALMDALARRSVAGATCRIQVLE
jgi:hypothetical protein